MAGVFKQLTWRRCFFAAGFILLLLFLVLPGDFPDRPCSTVLRSSDGRLLGAHIASDGQWRFPPPDSLPQKYITALLNFEDRWFRYHPGINPVSLTRSLILNIRARRVVSGGSTITMQVARMSGNNPPRTLPRKLLEMAMALKMELLHSKDYILKVYAANAPFGGNVVGIDAAAWRYFGRESDMLSWSEAALLAVLPNSPSLLYPGRNNPALTAKRNRLLATLLERGEIDSLTYSLAIVEPLPETIHSLPLLAPQLTDRIVARGEGKVYHTTIDYSLQEAVVRAAERNRQHNAFNGIHNIAAIVVETGSGRIIAYAGNISTPGGEHSGSVDMIVAPRSTGSILKPFLYAGMLESGELLPGMLVRDVPVDFSGYSPVNYDLTYSGAVKASMALSRSLNVPAVEMLRQHTPDRFLHLLHNLGFSTFERDAEHYGLSLILGGGETSLAELTGVYARMAAILNNYEQFGNYQPPFTHPWFLEEERGVASAAFPLGAASIWSAFTAMREVNRPTDYAGYENFISGGNIAWKTGTSFGYRDAWAIGISPRYVVGVWAGNADGEGRPGLTGVASAAPLLFDIFEILDPHGWFREPLGDMMEVEICRQSGHRAGPLCVDVDLVMIPVTGAATRPCPYHTMVHLTPDGQFQATRDCYPGGEVISTPWFVLPPAQEWYYRKNHPEYRMLPPSWPGCETLSGIEQIELLYPSNPGEIYIPVEHDGRRGRVVFEAAHRSNREKLFWHLDNDFIAETSLVHQVALSPPAGPHTLTIMDVYGNRLVERFVVIDK